MSKLGQKQMNFAVYTQRIAKLPTCSLRFICQDAQEAIDTNPEGANTGYYADEIHVCQSELRNRQKKMVNREPDYMSVLSKMYYILREAGYNSYDMIDDLKDLVNDSQRPATESEEDKHGLWAVSEEDSEAFKQDLTESFSDLDNPDAHKVAGGDFDQEEYERSCRPRPDGQREFGGRG